MKLIVFSKHLATKSPQELAAFAAELGIDGYDLCIRPGHPVTPENVATELPFVAKVMSNAGLAVPLVTGNFDLLEPDHPTARPILAAMAESGVKFLKLGYFKFDPAKHDYAEEVDRVRRVLAGWEELAAEHDITVCYHTHSNRCMGLNCAALAHLLEGRRPSCIGAYIDAGHMVVEGEEFAVGARMVRPHLKCVALKDVLVTREESDAGHGKEKRSWLESGRGMVDWTSVFKTLREIDFTGPLSVHCEFECEEDKREEAIKREVAFFRKFVPKA